MSIPNVFTLDTPRETRCQLCTDRLSVSLVVVVAVARGKRVNRGRFRDGFHASRSSNCVSMYEAVFQARLIALTFAIQWGKWRFQEFLFSLPILPRFSYIFT